MVLLTVLALASSQRLPATRVSSHTILEALRRDGHYTRLIRLFHTTGLDHQIGSQGQDYTLFAPRDEAFRRLSPEALKAVLDTDRYGASVAANMLLVGKYGQVSFMNGVSRPGEPLTYRMKTWGQTVLTTRSDSRGLFVDDARITGETIAVNGVVLMVDRLLVIHRPRPKGSGLQAILPAKLIEWGLAKYTD